jgi:hypothetical protein
MFSANKLRSFWVDLNIDLTHIAHNSKQISSLNYHNNKFDKYLMPTLSVVLFSYLNINNHGSLFNNFTPTSQ